MAWDEWEQLKQGAAQQRSTPTRFDQHPVGEGPGPSTSGATGDLKSTQQAWNRAGEGVGDLREGIGKVLSRLEDGQNGLGGGGSGCLSAGAQKDVYDSWVRYVTAVNERCGSVKKVLERAGRDLLTTDEAVKSSFCVIDAAYADTPAVGGRDSGR